MYYCDYMYLLWLFWDHIVYEQMCPVFSRQVLLKYENVIGMEVLVPI